MLRAITETDITVRQPVVQSVDRTDTDDDIATARAHSVIHGASEYEVFDLRSEEGRWKVCNLEG
ncbi:hypothetical protein ACTD5D_28275 [Nocardia takedensis]|uniref:hypothetical protein n=1 Tax=Nocardia takedensis TaxID=259390 RepID=UPI00031D0806|nr:hypothetical protein [Nocardia takedensis]